MTITDPEHIQSRIRETLWKWSHQSYELQTLRDLYRAMNLKREQVEPHVQAMHDGGELLAFASPPHATGRPATYFCLAYEPVIERGPTTENSRGRTTTRGRTVYRRGTTPAKPCSQFEGLEPVPPDIPVA